MDNKDIPQIIDNSAWPVEIKTELKQLAAHFIALLDEERDAIGEMHKARSGCNEKQYSKRLKEPLSDEKRNEVLSNQFAYRNWFANAVMRIHEARKQLAAQASLINGKVAELSPLADENKKLALIVLTRLVRTTVVENADSILSEFNNVSELSADRIFEAVRAIFASKRDREGIFFKQNYTSSPLMLSDPTDEEKAMDEAVVPAIAIRWQMEALWNEFTSARSALNVPQFNKRMELCIRENDHARLAHIRAEMANTEARLFVAATRYVEGHKVMQRAAERLEATIRAAAVSISDRNRISDIKAMCHCLGNWHWLGELTGYIDDKFRHSNPAAVLADLEFDPAIYLKA